MVAFHVFANASATPPAWAWVIWILAGGTVAAITARLSEIGRIGTAGYVIGGMLGAIMAGLILSTLGFSFDNLVWSVVAGVIGSLLVVLLFNVARGDRSMGGASGG